VPKIVAVATDVVGLMATVGATFTDGRLIDLYRNPRPGWCSISTDIGRGYVNTPVSFGSSTECRRADFVKVGPDAVLVSAVTPVGERGRRREFDAHRQRA